MIGVLCQLNATAPFRTEVEWWQPGFAEPGQQGGGPCARAPTGPAGRSPDAAR